jgi:proline iminopeptidase
MSAMKLQKIRCISLFFSILSVSPLLAVQSPDTPPDQTPPARSTVYPIKEGFVDVHGLFLYYAELGEGEPLIVLHGGPGGSHNYFLPYLLPLARTNRIIFMDERGSGRSGKLEDASGYTIENMVEDVEALRQALGLRSINLLGHSFGGVIAQAYALKYQKYLSHLILANTFDSTNELNQVWARLKTKIDPQHLRRIEELEKEGLFDKGKPWEHGRYTAEYAELAWGWAYYPYMYENHPNPNYNPLGNLGIAWDVYREMSGSNGEFVIDGNMTSVEYGEKLRSIRVPTLIIVGEHDEWSLQMSNEMHSNIPDSKLAVLPKCKHMTFVDQNGMFNNTVDTFIHVQSLSSEG